MAVDSPRDLYGLPLDQFTAERDALAKQLRADKEPERANEVKRLKKPTVAAWAVNQLVRTQPKEVRALFDAGDAIASSMSGKDAVEKLRRATAQQRDALAGLMDRAEGLLDSEGHPLAAGVLERVSETLRAASIDPESREQVKDACLTKELQFTGLGGFIAAGQPGKTVDEEADQEAKRKRDAELRAARDYRQEAEASVKQARREREKAEKRLKDAEAAVAAAADAVKEAEDKLATAHKQLDDAQARAD